MCFVSFPYFSVFGGIRKNESKENYLWLTKKVWLIFRDFFSTNFFWKIILSHSKLNKGSKEIIFQLI